MTIKPNSSDEELVQAIRTKDQELYIHLVTRYQDKLLRYANYLIGDKHIAKDVVQTAFIKAFQNLNGFDTRKKFSSWLYRITHNEAINAIKKTHREQILELEVWQNLESDQNIETEFERKQLQTTIKQSMNRLPASYKAPLTLFYLEERSYEDIGDILRLPMGTVATRINRGKKLLKSLLES